MTAVVRQLTVGEQAAMLAGGFLLERIDKAAADKKKVAELSIVVCDNDCKVHIRTTWGARIDRGGAREDWQKLVTEALDELDAIKPTDAKE